MQRAADNVLEPADARLDEGTPVGARRFLPDHSELRTKAAMA
jgi:hypothetical protein